MIEREEARRLLRLADSRAQGAGWVIDWHDRPAAPTMLTQADPTARALWRLR